MKSPTMRSALFFLVSVFGMGCATAVNATEFADATRAVCLAYTLDGFEQADVMARAKLSPARPGKRMTSGYSYDSKNFIDVVMEARRRTCDVIVAPPHGNVAMEFRPSQLRLEGRRLLESRGFKRLNITAPPSEFAFRDNYCQRLGGELVVAVLSGTADGEWPGTTTYFTVMRGAYQPGLC